MFVRYFVVFIVGLGDLFLLTLFLSPATVGVVYWILKMFGEVIFESGVFYFNGFDFEIIGACIATSAYYLLFLLVMITQKIELKKRLLMLGCGFLSLFLLNVSRILIMISLYWSSVFADVHWWLWHIFSIIFVVGIWFLMVKIFRIKSTPFWDDFQSILELKRIN